METEKVLELIGLSDKEVRVYLALLELGNGTAPGVSVKSGIKRPTTYLILEELRKKGLVISIPRKLKTMYTAKSPEILLEEQKEKERLISEKMPELLAIYNSKKEKPKVKFYQGEKQIVDLYNKEIFKSRMVDFYGSIGSIPESVYSQIEKNLNLILNSPQLCCGVSL
ncbi:MAG: helix-turn-helix domain-containing protein [Candidatus Pacebacteria bacterium]|nr:helix-turn-helix domain-containing protein [Candidatus Paceibacterota bacterium]